MCGRSHHGSALALLCGVALAAPSPARAQAVPLVVLEPPAPSGVIAEAQIEVTASAERVARLVADPASFIELFPAVEVKVLGREGEAQVVSVRKQAPWPVSSVSWVETVVEHREGDTLVVERHARPGGYFHHLDAVWRVRPLGQGRAEVSYRVWVELTGWAPLWAVRRGHVAGVRETMQRLAHMIDRSRTTASR
jgi:hypothetical protein